MSKFESFITANPSDPRVVRILKLIDTSALNSRVGKLIWVDDFDGHGAAAAAWNKRPTESRLTSALDEAFSVALENRCERETTWDRCCLSNARRLKVFARGVIAFGDTVYDQLAIVEHYEALARKARRDEITDGLIWLGWGAGSALLLVVGVLYFGGVL